MSTAPAATSSLAAPPAPAASPYATSVVGQPDSPQVKTIKQRFKDRHKVGNYRRWTFETRWLLNVLWGLGVQWTKVDPRSQKIVNMKLPVGFPRTTTNKFAKVNDDLLNAIISGDIQFNYMPGTDDPKDLGVAEVSDRLHEVIDDETQAKDRKRVLGFWFTYTGNGFIYPWYDYNQEHGNYPVPVYNCNNCALTGQQTQTIKPLSPCPTCGAPPTSTQQPPPPEIAGAVESMLGQPTAPPPQPQQVSNYTPATNPVSGQPQTQDIPIGKLSFDVGSPFEHYQDNTIPSGTDGHRWFLRFRRYDLDKAKMEWPDFKDVIVENMGEAFPLSRNYLLAIAYAGSVSNDYGSGDQSSKESLRRQTTPWELNELPTPEFPQGLRAVQLGDYIVEAGPLKTVWSAGIRKGQPWLPRVQFSMSDVGSAWGKPRADYLIPLQFNRNIIETALHLTARRTGSPKLLAPESAKIKNVVGEAGQILTYNPFSVAGGGSVAKPEYLEPALGNVQPFSEIIKMIDGDMEAIAGTFFLTGGDAPSGVVAASALSYLGEKAHQAVSPVKEKWAEAWAQCYQYALELARTNWVDERTISVIGKNKQWEFEKFKQADLAGSVSIKVDYQSLFPKSQATERATIMQLYQMLVLQPGDPDTDFKVLEAFGETKLKNLTNGAFAQAQREWDKFLNQQIPPVLKPLVQNSPLHLIQHKKDAQGQEYENLPPATQQLWDAHIQAHEMDVMAQQQLQNEMAGGGQPPPGPGGSGPHGQTQPGSQKGSQVGSASGNKVPASIQKGKSAADADAAAPSISHPIQTP